MINEHLVLIPILAPLTGALIALLLRKRPRAQSFWALGVMLFSLAVSVWLFVSVAQTGEPFVFALGGWEKPFGILIVGDLLGTVFTLMVQLVLVMGILYAMGCKDAVVGYPTFYPLFLTLATGLTGTMLTGDLFNMFVFVELLVLSSTVLIALSDDRLGTEAAYKYFYINLLASTFMLLAIGSLYVSYGTLNMASLAERVIGMGVRLLALPGMALLTVTFMIKSPVFPFHFWQPDIYTTAPTPVGAVLASVVGKLGVYGLLRITTLLFVEQSQMVRGPLIVLGVISIVFGGLSAIGTHNVKRMLAYSTLAQLGFIMVGVGWGTELALAAAIVFAFNHALIKSAMLMLAGYVASRTITKSASFAIVTGMGKPFPMSGALFFIGALALAGIPPTNGFVSKALLFYSGIDAEGFWALLVIGLASILTMIYSVRAFQRIWWNAPAEGVVTQSTGDRLIAPLILIGLVLILGLWAEPLVTAAQITSQWLGDPMNYIQAVLGG